MDPGGTEDARARRNRTLEFIGRDDMIAWFMLGFDVLGENALAEISSPLILNPPAIFTPPSVQGEKSRPSLKGEVDQ